MSALMLVLLVWLAVSLVVVAGASLVLESADRSVLRLRAAEAPLPPTRAEAIAIVRDETRAMVHAYARRHRCSRAMAVLLLAVGLAAREDDDEHP